ncbi:acyl-CoA synthetase [Microbacterium sp. YY-01]|uniref:acyl-CoA synthetase n=1 Tax=Microbacterium sp. YY-01 TaxID=3421634 RepID=UPI003D16F5EC
MSATARAFDVRHVQLGRALIAAVAAVMIAFSADHSAAVGLSVFGGFATATALVCGLGAWLVRSQRSLLVALAVVALLASIMTSVQALHSTTYFFILVMSWAAVAGAIELIVSIRARRTDTAARDGLLVGALTLLLVVALLLVPMQYSWDYTIDEAGTFTLTGITLAVGIFGAYAAIVAVLLAIAGFSPRREMRTEAPGPVEGLTTTVDAAEGTDEVSSTSGVRAGSPNNGGTA